MPLMSSAVSHMQTAGAASRLPATVCRRPRQALPAVRASAAKPSTGSNSGSAEAASCLDCSLRLAAVRAVEQRQEFPLFADAFSAPALAAATAAAAELQQQPVQPDAEAAAEAAAAVAAAAAAAAADPAAAAGSIAVLLDGGDAAEVAREALATRFLDEQLLKAVTLVNMERDLTQVLAIRGQRRTAQGMPQQGGSTVERLQQLLVARGASPWQQGR